jgi:hypothetical protein
MPEERKEADTRGVCGMSMTRSGDVRHNLVEEGL